MTSTLGIKKIQYPNGTDILTLDSSGSIAIGAAATIGGTLTVNDPIQILNGSNVNDASTDADDLIIEGPNDCGLSILSATTGRIFFGDAADNDVGSIRYIHTDNSMRFETNAGERMRITDTGNIGIGTSSPVASSGGRFVTIETTADENTNVVFNTANTNRAGIIEARRTGRSGAERYAQINLQNTNDIGEIIFNTAASGYDVAQRAKIGHLGDLYVQRVYNNTTGNGANIFIASDGQFLRSTSSQRYKNTINDATHGLTELLTLRPVTYKSNHDHDSDNIFGGLIAEEVHDAGLTEFVQYNEDNQPDALAYGNMVSLCIKAIQELKTELDNAKARITELESK